MTINKIIRTIMTAKGVSLANMAALIGKKRGNDISARLTNATNMSIDKADEMLKVLNYKIVVVPVDFQISDDSYEVTKEV